MEGITITNGKAYHGGGLFTHVSGADVILTDSIIKNSIGYRVRRGIYTGASGDGGVNLERVKIIGNTGSYGGGAFIYTANGTESISNCIIAGNTASYSGGGAYIYGQGNKNITNNTITGNQVTTEGLGTGGLHIESDNLRLLIFTIILSGGTVPQVMATCTTTGTILWLSSITTSTRPRSMGRSQLQGTISILNRIS